MQYFLLYKLVQNAVMVASQIRKKSNISFTQKENEGNHVVSQDNNVFFDVAPSNSAKLLTRSVAIARRVMLHAPKPLGRATSLPMESPASCKDSG